MEFSWRSNLANLRRELGDEIGKTNKLGLCQDYLGIDLGDAKSINNSGLGLAFGSEMLLKASKSGLIKYEILRNIIKNKYNNKGINGGVNAIRTAD